MQAQGEDAKGCWREILRAVLEKPVRQGTYMPPSQDLVPRAKVTLARWERHLSQSGSGTFEHRPSTVSLANRLVTA